MNTGLSSSVFKNFEKLNNYKIYNSINLPNSNFFESTGTFLNNEGYLKKNVKLVNSPVQVKDDWQIIRKILAYSKKINFISNSKDNYQLSFTNSTVNKFNAFINLLMFSNISLTNFKIKNKVKHFNLNNLGFCHKQKLEKIQTTKFKIWLNDFYIGGTDFYSKNSSTMVTCSQQLRLISHNFKYLI